MIIVTQNSTYEFDADQKQYRKIKPGFGNWKSYECFFLDPCVGKSLRIVRDFNTMTTTSKVLEIHEDKDD